ncbi:hypothetical protein FRC02_006432 [Tulasnella sp. 418]|nr:hypothetical protein FRC02_006432 [Tulasnella sp. 418]
MAEVDSFQEINRKYFNQIANTYDDILPTMREHTAKIAQVMTEQVKLDPETTSVMDFACGTGLVSINLVPYVKEVIGVDISEAMVEKYNEKASLNEVSAKKMKAVLLDISKDKEGLGGKKFDAIICSMSYHHFDQVQEMTNNLVEYLVPGTGVLLVVDLIRTEHTVACHTATKHICSHVGGRYTPHFDPWHLGDFFEYSRFRGKSNPGSV